MRRLVLCSVVVLLAVAGCGGDDEDSSTAASTTPTELQPEDIESIPTTATLTSTETEPSMPTTPTSSTSPEDVPGGAGDAEPARTLAQFTGKGGQIRPRVVRVAPFIAVRVELRSEDGTGYVLDFGGGKGLTTGPQVSSSSTEFDGLRPNEELVGRPVGNKGNAVRVIASAEPGP